MATPTFHAELDALTDLVADVTGTATEIATSTYDWGTGTKSNVVAGAGIRWPSRAGIWTDPNNWTVVIVAKPDSVKAGELSQVFTIADPGGSYLLCSFFGDYASASSGAECFAAIHYKSGSFRRGGFSSVDVCDGADHVYIARRTGATFEIFVDGTLVSTTTLAVGTATLTGTASTVSLHCSGTYGANTYLNRQAPLGMVKFYNEAITNEELAALSSDPFEAGGGSTDATGTGSLPYITLSVPTGSATGTGGATNGTGTGALQSVVLTAPAGSGVGTSAGLGTITTPVLKNNTGTVLANETGVTVNIYNASTGALIVQKTGQTSNASGIVTVSDALIVSGTSYAYEVVLTGSRRRLPLGLAA